MAKLIVATFLLFVITLLGVIPSVVSAQSTCSTGTAVANAANAPGLTADCNALLTARDALVGNAVLNWSADLAISDWDGVTVDGTPERVTGLNLRAYRLNGEIPAELGRLANLKSLHLGENQLIGEIPAELDGLANLERLYLNGNRLDGEIPAALSSLASLERLYLNGNQLTGEIPTELGSLINLRVLSLSQNRFTGEIPSALGDLVSLESLYLNGNQLSEAIPAELGSLINLRVLSLSQNRLTGEIPSALGDLVSLESLYLDGNQLTGEIPAELGNLANLQDLRLGGNQLTGCIPQALREVVSDLSMLSLTFCSIEIIDGAVTVIIAKTPSDAPVRINSPIPVKATFSEPVFGFTAEDISVAYGVVDSFAGNDGDDVYTFDVTPIAAGAVTVNIAAGTAANTGGGGNEKAAQLSLGIPYDDDNDRSISRSEVIQAIIDYFGALISRGQVIGVITLYFSAPVVTPNEANAGPDSEALELSSVMLDGTLSSGPDGSISSYQWEQVINGARIVLLTNADTAAPGFTLPPLGGDQDLVFRLTVTYNSGETSQDEVTIKGRPTPKVIVSAVSGNTASLNGVAEFYVRLRGRPSANVVIPLSSSDESQGILEQTQVVFTPENWGVEQIITVRGQNANVQGGVQDYEIILGDSQSSDSLYDSLETPNVPMKGVALEIAPPQQIEPLIANLPATIEPTLTHTGSNLLSFSLTQAPAGMSIDFSYGAISWTPQESDEGQTFDVTVQVTDGARFVETSFQVAVIQPQPLVTDTQSNVLTVTDQTTTLNGMSITALPPTPGVSPIPLSTLEKAPLESVPETPPWITSITDVFVVKSSFDNPVELRFPIGQLPDGTSPGNVNLYAYVEALDGERQFWSPVAIERSSEGTEASPVYVVSLGGLQGMAFFGYHITSPAIPLESNSVMPPDPDKIECRGTSQDTGPIDFNDITCTYEDDDDIEIKIHGWSSGDSAGTHWNNCAGMIGPSDLASWLIEAQSDFEALDLGYDKEITVSIHDTNQYIFGLLVGTVLGYVTTEHSENRRTLHLTNDDTISSCLMQGTAVHEYFHHAQGHGDTKNASDDTTLLVTDGSVNRIGWLIEGTARWFEDEVYDDLNTYVDAEGVGFRVMEAGVNSRASSKDLTQRPYQRFSFFKLLDEKCPNFKGQFRNFMNTDLVNDPTGIKNLSGLLDDANCDFGDHLGQDRSGSLAAAIGYYNYATQFKNDIKLLDDNESSSAFDFVPAPSINLPTDFNAGICPDIDGVYLVADDLYRTRPTGVKIPGNGALSVLVPESGCNLLSGKVVELIIESASAREVIVSITSGSPDFIGANHIGADMDDHGWFSTATGETSYVVAKGPTGTEIKTIPDIFVTLVNPSLEDIASVIARIVVRDEVVDTGVDTIITSHEDGDQVDDRVVAIAGSIPEEARDATEKVIVTANGITTETSLNQVGVFTVDVVVSFGDNLIRAQGFEAGGKAVTNETTITIKGVQNSSEVRNALIPARVVFVLRWDTNSTDVDIYSTDKNGGTVWFSNLEEYPGSLDFDDTTGFGPEVISYRVVDHNVYDNGTFDVDIHYYDDYYDDYDPETNYTLDVVLNETDPGKRRLRRYESTVPLTVSTYQHAGPSGSGPSRFNDVLTVYCSDSNRDCSVTNIDTSKLAAAGAAGTPTAAAHVGRVATAEARQVDSSPSSAYKQCLTELKGALSKHRGVSWSCNPDGAKQ